MFRDSPNAFKGGLSAGNYATITEASPATTTRDLADLVAKGALVRVGERRHARYHIEVLNGRYRQPNRFRPLPKTVKQSGQQMGAGRKTAFWDLAQLLSLVEKSRLVVVA